MDHYDQSEILRHEAFSHYSAGDHSKALELYNSSFDLHPNPGALRGIGECYSAMGRSREAIVYLAASVGMSPCPKASFQLGEELLRAGHLYAAKRAVEDAITRLPHFKAAQELLSEIEQEIQASQHTPPPPS